MTDDSADWGDTDTDRESWLDGTSSPEGNVQPASPDHRPATQPPADGGGPTAEDGPPDSPIGARPPRICKRDGCDNPLPPGSAPARRYCDEHQPQQAKEPSGKPRGRPPKTPATPAKKGDLDKVESNARMIAQGISGVFGLAAKGWVLTPDAPVRNPDLFADATNIEAGGKDWARAVRNVAVHEQWLADFLGGSSPSDRALAWAALLMATGAMALPILIRHKMIPAELLAFIPSEPLTPPASPSEPVPAESTPLAA